MSKKGLLSIIATLVIIIAVIVLQKFSGPDLTPYLALESPAIRTMKPQKVLVVEARGDPAKTGKEAFKLLFKAYFGLKGVAKGKGMSAPRARWPIDASLPRQQWIGRYAMPLPDTVRDVAFPPVPEGMQMKIATWRYGEVAEILHRGPYKEEKSAIERLSSFIAAQGYEIVGEHEEEYLKGPGAFFKGKPRDYMTIIRYPVRKRVADTPADTSSKG
ncbi:MAG: GyrI-like domain-containing protein [Chitinispirillaceae bacterium]|nr:GyrI-like domain-containing protein [Chitinispirillaceae bacterium]